MREHMGEGIVVWPTTRRFRRCLGCLEIDHDGYHFTAPPDIYNPFSLLNALAECNQIPVGSKRYAHLFDRMPNKLS